MRIITAMLGIFIVLTCSAPSVASETDRTGVFVTHSAKLTDQVVQKYRARLRIAGVLAACEQDHLSKKVWISAEAQVEEVWAYMDANSEAESLGDQLLAGLNIGLAYYRAGVVDTARAYVLGKPLDRDSFCSSATDAAKLLLAP